MFEEKLKSMEIMEHIRNIWSELMDFMDENYDCEKMCEDKNMNIKFRKSGKTIVSMCINADKVNVLIIYGKNERAVFEEKTNEFSDYIVEFYNKSKTFHDGKWMFIDLFDKTYVDDIKKMILIKKKPNKKYI